MTRKEVKEMLPVLQAYAEGKEIESLVNGKYYRVLEICNGMNPKDYRIKPEPKYRPFKNAEECWQEMLKHQPFGWIKDHSSFSYIIYLEDEMIGYGRVSGTILHDNFKDALRCYAFADGTPFGVKKG